MSISGEVRKVYRTIADRSILRRIGSYEQIDGWLEKSEAAALCRLASRLPNGANILEIGCWKGKSTFCLATGLRSGRVHVIDSFDAAGDTPSRLLYAQQKGARPLVEQFQENLRERGVLEKVEIHVGYSQSFVGKIPELDLLFIDGDHSREGCAFDFEHFSPLLRIGGYLLIHDFDRREPEAGPTWVVQNRVLTDVKFQYYGLFHRLWAARKK